MQPNIQLNWLAIIAGVATSCAIGSLWYGTLFRKVWARAMEFPGDAGPSGAEIAKGSAINLVGTLLTAFVLAHEVLVWRPSAWNAGPDRSPAVYGFFAALFVWLGFIVPVLLNGVAFERKSWKVFGINAAFQLISLLAMGMILSFWR